MTKAQTAYCLGFKSPLSRLLRYYSVQYRFRVIMAPCSTCLAFLAGP